MRVLIITNLYPNCRRPTASTFNRQQFSALRSLCSVEILATIPWYPGQRWLGRFSETQIEQAVPSRETLDGIEVHHPRTLHLPRIGRVVAAPLYATSLLPTVNRYRSRVDVVLGAWAHPDGCAAIALAKFLGVPAVVKLHGSDINVGATLPGPRRVMKLMLPKAAGIVAVSRRLGEDVTRLGVDPQKVHVVLNGVDKERFFVRDRNAARDKLGLPRQKRIALYVGNLKESKGVCDLRHAFEQVTAQAPNLHLYFVGGGSIQEKLKNACPKRMHVVGAQAFDEIPTWMAACDFLVLPSWDEGTPNVLLEALACGRQVLATDVGGVPDVVSAPSLGSMVPRRDVPRLSAALLDMANRTYNPRAVADLGARHDWNSSARNLFNVLQIAVDKGQSS